MKKNFNHHHKDPIQKLVTLMNQYWSIDLMEATSEEKLWAKDRLKKQVMGISNHISSNLKGDIQASFQSKDMWNRVRNIIG